MLKPQQLKILVAAGLSLLLILIFLKFFASSKQNHNMPLANSTPTADGDLGNQAKSQLSSPPITPATVSPPVGSGSLQPTGTAPTPAPAITLTAIRSGQVGQYVQFRAYVLGAASGTCTATYSRGTEKVVQVGQIKTETTGIVDCIDTDLATNRLSTSGTWEGTLSAGNGPMKSNVLTASIEVTK